MALSAGESMKPQTAKCSTILMELANNVEIYSKELADRTADNLFNVTRETAPSSDEAKKGVVEDAWPTFLNDLRSKLWGIRRNLASIADTLDRLEI